MFKIDNKTYIIDLDKLMQWVSQTPSSEKNVSTTITQIIPIMEEENSEIENALSGITTKEITENKDSLNDIMNNIRYDIIKILLLNILQTENNIVNTQIDYSSFERGMTCYQKLCFNSLLNKGIIIELKEK